MASVRTGLHTEINFFPHAAIAWVHYYRQQEPHITHHVLQRPLPQLKRTPGSNISGRRQQASIDLSCVRSNRVPQQAASKCSKLSVTIALRFPSTCAITGCKDHRITRDTDAPVPRSTCKLPVGQVLPAPQRCSKKGKHEKKPALTCSDLICPCSL